MNSDPLEMLRDIHEPLAPHWFPPAPGWWLLALGAAAAAVAAWLALRRHRRAAAPYVYAAELFTQAHGRYRSGELDARAFIDAANDVLKRLLIHVERRSQATTATGKDWTDLLARRFDEPAFRGSAGTALGTGRYSRLPPRELDATEALLVGVFANPPRWWVRSR